MNIISADKISRRLGDKTLFENVSFGINEGEKIGLIGTNGSGKSALMRLLSGRDTPDTGQILRGRDLRIAHLKQAPDFEPAHTIREHVFQSDSPLVELIRKYEEVCDKIQAGDEEVPENAQNELDALTAEMNRRDAWRFESDIKSILHELGIRDLELKMGALSGGMLKKVALAQAMIDESDLLLLDEPTNHLDLETILLLQNRLQKTKQALVLVTHDRYFLDEVVDKIYEVDGGDLYQYNGPYSFYLEKHAERQEAQARQESKARSFLRTELEWLRRQPKARGTKQKARIDRIDEVEKRKRAPSQAKFEFTVSGRRLGKRILEVKDIGHDYGEGPLFSNFTYYFKRNERIGLVGPNGSGKSTLLNIFTGRMAPGQGEVVAGVNTVFGYFDQVGAILEKEKESRMITFIKQNAGERLMLGDSSMEASRVLEYFGFNGRLQNAPIAKLSGGERRRLFMVYTLLQNPNFLILDEPTNDLDIRTLSLMEDLLQGFPGCLLTVSHDRYFMDRVVDTLLILDGQGGLESFPGNYGDYLEYRRRKSGEQSRERKAEKKAIDPSAENSIGAASSAPLKKKKFSYKEKKEFDGLEAAIEELEGEKSALEEKLSAGRGDYDEIAGWGERLAEVEVLLDHKMERWSELADSVESTEV